MKKCFSIAELKISLEYEPDSYDIFLDKALENFSSEQYEKPDIRFYIDTISPFPSLDSYKKVFASYPHGIWALYEDTNKSHYIITLQDEENRIFKIVKANRKLDEAIIFTKPDENNLLTLIDYPIDELVIAGHLNINGVGIIIHSACVSVAGKTILFSGVSGSGKSTLAQIWQKDNKAKVLTDERTIIRYIGNELWSFGTPWHGTSEVHKNTGGPIDTIFFIKHGNKNAAFPLRKVDAANDLFVRCFPTFWNQKGLKFALDFCASIASVKQCYVLEFAPSFSAIEYIKHLCYGHMN